MFIALCKMEGCDFMTVDRPTTINEYVTCSLLWLGYLLTSVYVIHLAFKSI
jgi:hypothetical protein